MSSGHSNTRNTTKYRLLLNNKKTSNGKTNNSIVYSLTPPEDEEMGGDSVPLINPLDSNFDEDDYLSESNRKSYGMYSNNGNASKNKKSCCGKCWWCLCGGWWQLCAR